MAIGGDGGRLGAVVGPLGLHFHIRRLACKTHVFFIRVEFVCDALVPRDSIVMLEFLEVRL